MHKNLLLGLGALVAIAGIGYVATTPAPSPELAVTVSEESVLETPETLTADEPVTEEPELEPEPEAEPNTNADTVIETDAVETELVLEEVSDPAPLLSGTFTEYDAAKVAASEAEHVVLFFRAPWCPSCRALERDIQANATNIPAGVEIYRVDFDTEIALKRELGIVRQHSVIEVTPEGSPVGPVSHPANLAALVAAL